MASSGLRHRHTTTASSSLQRQSLQNLVESTQREDRLADEPEVLSEYRPLTATTTQSKANAVSPARGEYNYSNRSSTDDGGKAGGAIGRVSAFLGGFACVILDWLPNTFSINLFATELKPREKNILSSFEMACVRKFDKTLPAHMGALLQLWAVLNQQRTGSIAVEPPDLPNDLKSEDWKLFGFQGVDPLNDIRGSGIFGLLNLMFFAEAYPDDFRRLLRGATDYPFVITGFNVTLQLLNMLQLTAGKATCLQSSTSFSSHCARVNFSRMMINAGVTSERSSSTSAAFAASDGATLHFSSTHKAMAAVFGKVYCAAFVVVHNTWKSGARNIMEFNSDLRASMNKMETIIRTANTVEDIVSAAQLH